MRTFSEPQRYHRLFLTLVVVALFLPITGIGHCFTDVHHHQDVVTDLFKRFSTDPSDALLQSVRHPSSVSYGRTVPLLYPYLMVLYGLTRGCDPAQHVFNACVWLLLAHLAFSWARHLTKARWAPLMAGLLTPLYWPVARALFRPHVQETPMAIAMLAALLAVYHAERSIMSAPPERLKTVGWCCGAVALLWLALGLKETAIALFAPLFFLHAVAFFSANSGLRKLHIVLCGVTMLCAGLYFCLISLTPIASGSYASSYGLQDAPHLVQMAMQWRELALAGYGPIFGLGMASLLVRFFWGVRNRAFPASLKWRLALVLLALVSLGLVIPWDRGCLMGRLILPAVLSLNIVFACELAELWELARTRSATRPDARQRSAFTVWLLVLVAIAFWVFPSVTFPFHQTIVVGKMVLLGATVALGIVVFRHERETYVSSGALSRGAGRAVLVLLIGGGAWYFGWAVLLLHTSYEQAMQHAVTRYDPLFRLLAQKAPPWGRVLVNTDSEWLSEFGAHIHRCLDRNDIQVMSLDFLESPIRATDTIVSLPVGEKYDLPTLARCPELTDHKASFFHNRSLWFNGVFVQPGRFTLSLLGLSDPRSMPPPAVSYQWQRVYRWIDQTAVIYCPNQ